MWLPAASIWIQTLIFDNLRPFKKLIFMRFFVPEVLTYFSFGSQPPPEYQKNGPKLLPDQCFITSVIFFWLNKKKLVISGNY